MLVGPERMLSSPPPSSQSLAFLEHSRCWPPGRVDPREAGLRCPCGHQVSLPSLEIAARAGDTFLHIGPAHLRPRN